MVLSGTAWTTSGSGLATSNQHHTTGEPREGAGERQGVMGRGPVARWCRTVGVGAVVTALAVLGVVVPTQAAQAADPPPPAPPATVSADALPTWQINGVVYSQAIVGDIVYVTGSFTRARPPGVAAGGAGEVVANNIFAYRLS